LQQPVPDYHAQVQGDREPDHLEFHYGRRRFSVDELYVAFVMDGADSYHALLMACMGVAGVCGHYLLIKAFERASPAVLDPFSYGQLLWAMLLGYLVFGAFPNAGSILGGGNRGERAVHYVSSHRAAAQTPLIADQKELSPSDFMRDTGQPR
jgi:hypothetical protein